MRITLELLTKRQEKKIFGRLLEKNKMREKNRKSLKNVSYLIGKFVKTYTIFYYEMKSDFLNQFSFENLEDVIMEDKMKKLAKHKESREARDIYSDSDDEDKREDKEELIEEKEKCEEQSKDNLTPEGGDVCDSGDHESNGKDKEELVQQQEGEL